MSLDDAVEQVPADEAKLVVNGGGGAADEIPFLLGVVGQGGISVLQVRDGNWVSLVSIFVRFELLEKLLLTEPVVDPEIGKEVPNEHVGPAKRLAEINQPRDGDSKAQIA